MLLYLTYKNLWKNIKKSCKNNKFKISALTWNEEFELPNTSYSASDIQDYFEYNFRKTEESLVILQYKYA